MTHSAVGSASFSPNSTRVVTAFWGGTARLWDVDVEIASSEYAFAPSEYTFLVGTADALSGYRVNESCAIVPVTSTPELLARLRDRVAAGRPAEPSARWFLHWLLEDPSERTISPQSIVSVGDYITARLKECDIEARTEVEHAFPGHPLLQRADELCAHH